MSDLIHCPELMKLRFLGLHIESRMFGYDFLEERLVSVKPKNFVKFSMTFLNVWDHFQLQKLQKQK